MDLSSDSYNIPFGPNSNCTLDLSSDSYNIPFGPNSNCTLDICSVQDSVYGYRPSLPANITLTCLYGIALAIHLVLGFKWRSWWFMGCMIAGCVDAMVGYVSRIGLYYDPFSFTSFMTQIVCVTTAPVFYCAAIYVALAKTVHILSPSLSRFPPKLFYWIFIPCDIFSLVLQAAGGTLSTTSSGQNSTGVNLSLSGLSFQVFTLVVFCLLFADYLLRYFRSVSAEEARAMLNGRGPLFLGFLGLAILAMLARCVYRVDELSEGWYGPLIGNETLFIALEGGLIVISVFALCIGHPGFMFGKDIYDANPPNWLIRRLDQFDITLMLRSLNPGKVGVGNVI